MPRSCVRSTAFRNIFGCAGKAISEHLGIRLSRTCTLMAVPDLLCPRAVETQSSRREWVIRRRRFVPGVAEGCLIYPVRPLEEEEFSDPFFRSPKENRTYPRLPQARSKL